MELTLASAFSAEGLLGHTAYVFLIISMLMRTLLWLRVLVIISACLGIVYSSIILGDPVSTFWESLLVLVNVGQLTLTHWRSLRARFTDDEQRFVTLHLAGLQRAVARDFLDLGAWRRLEAGAVLTEAGKPVGHLTYVASGRVAILADGRQVADCGAGDFIGEMTALTGAGATATVVTQEPTVVWQIEATRLRAVVDRRDAVEREIDAAFARNYRVKIVQMNALAAAGQIAS